MLQKYTELNNQIIISQHFNICYDGLTDRRMLQWKQNTDTNEIAEYQFQRVMNTNVKSTKYSQDVYKRQPLHSVYLVAAYLPRKSPTVFCWRKKILKIFNSNKIGRKIHACILFSQNEKHSK